VSIATLLCEHSSKKKHCGKILNILTSAMQTEEAVSFILNVVSHDFFLYFSGTWQDLYRKLHGVGEQVETAVRSLHGSAEVMESDEDEAGNLRYVA
jgi:hypothetical protein